MSEAPPSLPGVLSRPDAQIIIDALNKRLWEVEKEDSEKLVGSGLKMVRGTINTAGSGSIVQGTGFTISRVGAGNVTVTFSPAFSGVPTVVTGHQTAIHNANNGEPTKEKVTLGLIITTTAEAVDGIVSFIAIGPR